VVDIVDPFKQAPSSGIIDPFKQAAPAAEDDGKQF
jgi:hypothetical protein